MVLVLLDRRVPVHLALRSGQRGVAGGLGQPPGKRPQHLALDRRVPVEHGVELPGCQHEQAYGGLGRHRRRARQLGDQGDLTHEVAAGQRRDPPALPDDLDLAVDEHEELVPDLALLAQDPARLNLQVLADPLQLDELLAGEAREEGDALERLHLGVLAEQSHGSNPSSSTPAGASRQRCHPDQAPQPASQASSAAATGTRTWTAWYASVVDAACGMCNLPALRGTRTCRGCRRSTAAARIHGGGSVTRPSTVGWVRVVGARAPTVPVLSGRTPGAGFSLHHGLPESSGTYVRSTSV